MRRRPCAPGRTAIPLSAYFRIGVNRRRHPRDRFGATLEKQKKDLAPSFVKRHDARRKKRFRDRYGAGAKGKKAKRAKK